MEIAKNILISALIFVVLFFVLAPRNQEVDTKVITKIDTLRTDTTIYKWKKGKDILKYTIIYDTISINTIVDTSAILKDFFAKNVFTDTLSLPEGTIAINDTISENKIFGRSYNAKITQKTIVKVREIRTTIAPKGTLYWGFMGTKQDQTYGFGAGIMYKSANKGIIQLNITNNKQFQIGYYSKIF
jgi:hypothetical protein